MDEMIEKKNSLTDPFAAVASFSNYYEDNVRREFLLQLVHLTEFTNTILFIVGKYESGKTALLQQFVNSADGQWILCVTSATEVATTVSLMRKLSHDFELPGLPHSSVNQTFIEQLSLTKQKGHTPVLIIDDADKLSTELLDVLVQLSTNIFPVDLRIILAGRSIPQILLQMNDTDDPGITELSLPPFTELQTAEYISSRLSLSNFSGANPFTQDLIHKIYKQSKGQPGHINVLASTILKEALMKPDNVNIQFGAPRRQQSALKLVALALGISVLLSVYLFNTTDEEQILDPEVATDNEEEKLTKMLAIPGIEAGDGLGEQDVSTPNQSFSSRSDKMIGAQESAEHTISLALKNKNAESADVAHLAPKTADSLAQSKDEITGGNKIAGIVTDIAASSTLEPEIAQVNPIRKNKAKDESRGEAWILKQNSKHYTIQLISFASAKAAQNFINKMGLAADAHFFSFKKGKKVFFPVIVGAYNSKSSAIDRSKALPEQLAKLKPWIRSFKSLQNLLSKS